MAQEIQADVPDSPLAVDMTRWILNAERETGMWIRAQGFLVGDAFLVLRESGAFADEEPESGPSLGSAERDLRAGLVSNGHLVPDGNTYVFLHDCLFSSPAAAATAILGRSVSGHREWCDGRGNRLADALG